MGLTIHWNQRGDKPLTEQEARLAVEFVKDIAVRSKWEVLSEWDEVVEQSDYTIDNDFKPTKLSPGKVKQFGISIWPHKDCEDITIGFYETQPGMFMLGYFIEYSPESKQHKSSSFCKTHYAGFAVHKKVCRFFEALDKYFVPLEVSDDCRYYGNWDDEQGAKEFGEYIAFVRDLGAKLKGSFGAENVQGSEDTIDGWKDDYVDHLARQFKEKKK